MNKTLKKFHSQQGGFTLIELLVVIAIIAILAAIIIPNVGGYISSGQTAADEAELTLVRNAVAAVMAAGGVGDLGPAADWPPNRTVAWGVADTISNASDLTITDTKGTADPADDVEYHASDYFANGLAEIKHTYAGITDQGYVPSPW